MINTPVALVNIIDSSKSVVDGLDLILPCFNPHKGWEMVFSRNYKMLKAEMPLVPIRVILVNDGSMINFGTQQINYLKTIASEICIVSFVHNKGKGHAVRAGLKEAKFSYHICMDWDFPFGISAIKKAYEQLLAGVDVVVGDREREYMDRLPMKRKILTSLCRFANRFILKLKANDAQAGFKAFNIKGREIMQETTINGFLYDSEFLFKISRRKNIKLVPIPLSCRPDLKFSSFGTRTLIRECCNYLKILILKGKK